MNSYNLFYSFLEVIWLTESKKMKRFNISEQSINYPLPSVTLSGAAPNSAEANQSGEVWIGGSSLKRRCKHIDQSTHDRVRCTHPSLALLHPSNLSMSYPTLIAFIRVNTTQQPQCKNVHTAFKSKNQEMAYRMQNKAMRDGQRIQIYNLYAVFWCAHTHSTQKLNVIQHNILSILESIF